MSVSVVASVVLSGCSAAPDDAFEQQAPGQEDIGSVQQASLPVGAWTIADCWGDLTSLPPDAAYAVLQICMDSPFPGKIPIIVSATTRFVHHRIEQLSPGVRSFWYAVLPSTPGSTHNSWDSCDFPYSHAFFYGTYNTNTSCRANPLASEYYDDFTSAERTSECTWLKSQTAFVNAAAANGLTIAANCSNVVGFDPFETSGQCAVGGWVC
jgi:hypothetical protein